jgi:transposase-like protein
VVEKRHASGQIKEKRSNKLVRKRTRVVGIFPNEEALLRFASGVLAEIDDQWATEKKYLARDEDGPTSRRK